MSNIYELMIKKVQTEIPKTFHIEKEDIKDLLGIQFTMETVDLTKDGKNKLPAIMVAEIKSGSIAEKVGLKLGTVIEKVNGVPINVDTYYDEIAKHKSFDLKVNESFCPIYKFINS
jgi:S1-C subfamily serine protease